VISWTKVRGVAVADVDGDHDLDIYALRSQGVGGGTNPVDLLLRNRGNGTFSVQTAGAWKTKGVGGRCAAIDHDQDGRAGVLVVNSYDTVPKGVGPLEPGPLELMIQR
jgi:hypothetical protein